MLNGALAAISLGQAQGDRFQLRRWHDPVDQAQSFGTGGPAEMLMQRTQPGGGHAA